MPENRARKHHQERLGVALREEITTIIEGELSDPRIGSAAVSEVHLAPDGRSARVFIFVSGDEAEERGTMKGLMAAKGYVRHEIAERLGLRHPPELIFELDRSDKFGSRVDELLGRIDKRKRRNSPSQEGGNR
jgi:ribosome-binding factor A